MYTNMFKNDSATTPPLECNYMTTTLPLHFGSILAKKPLFKYDLSTTPGLSFNLFNNVRPKVYPTLPCNNVILKVEFHYIDVISVSMLNSFFLNARDIKCVAFALIFCFSIYWHFETKIEFVHAEMEDPKSCKHPSFTSVLYI